jgi:hypothetical protein
MLARAPQGHDEIDNTRVDSTKRVDEYDEQTQAEIRKIMVCPRLLLLLCAACWLRPLLP